HFLFSAMARHKSWILKGAWALFLAVLLAALCWTYSRSSWVGFLVIMIAMSWLDRRKIKLAGALLVVFVLFFMPSLGHVRHMNLMKDNIENAQEVLGIKSLLEQSGSGRFWFWKNAVSIIRSSPVWGTGLNTYARI